MVEKSTIRYMTFPRTTVPDLFVTDIVRCFRENEAAISSVNRTVDERLESDKVLAIIRSALCNIGFQVERGKKQGEKIERPVIFGENGKAELKYEIDAYHSDWCCGLEVEAGRALMGNAVYRDLIQALVMVGVDTLCLAVSNEYKYKTKERVTVSKDYELTCKIAEALFGHSRISLPYKLIVIGY